MTRRSVSRSLSFSQSLILQQEPAEVGQADGEWATMWETALNMANALEGMGLLALPYVVLLCGWMGFAAVALTGALSGYTACLIIASLYSWETDSNGNGNWVRVRSSYAENGMAACGKYGRTLVFIVQLGALIVITSLFLVLVGVSVYGLVPQLLPAGSAALKWSPRLWTFFAFLVAAPGAWIPGMRQLSWVSSAGVLALAVVIIAVGVGAALAVNDSQDHSEFWQNRLFHQLPDLSKALASTPCALSIVLFSFSAHSMMPQLEAGMAPAERHRFPLVVLVTFTLSTAAKAIFMALAWIALGPDLTDVAIENLSPFVLRVIASVAVSLNTILTIPLLIFICLCVLQGLIPPSMPTIAKSDSTTAPLLGDAINTNDSMRAKGSIDEPPNETEVAARPRGPPTFSHTRRGIVVLLVGGIAVAVPHLAVLMAYVGSVLSSLVVFVLPGVFHASIRHRNNKLSVSMAVADLCIVCLGLVGAVLGLDKTIAGLCDSA